MKTYADLLYELADFLQEEGRRLESGYGLSGLNETYRAKAEDIRQVLRTTPYADVLTTEQVTGYRADCTKRDIRPSAQVACSWIVSLCDSHEAMRRALDTNASVAERYAAGWYRSTCGTKWLAGDHIEVQDMTPDEIQWHKSWAEEGGAGG